ncbi:MAG TPA: 8-oxo-dGTP diphosphatase [Candidatus Magasanikbacteria bacterium]|nr:8-oxo-dGTP diphosphatase [Candidatus Magasanikbacteria bacterium]
MKKILTLCIVHDESRVLLGMKKRGFGMDKWNGFGGKIQDGETIEQAAVRELQEEAGITPLKMEQFGLLNFKFQDGASEEMEVAVFSVTDFDGIPTESEEMRPAWFLKSEIPYEKMWADDKYWLPLLFAGKKFNGNFEYMDYNIMLSHEVEELNQIL